MCQASDIVYTDSPVYQLMCQASGIVYTDLPVCQLMCQASDIVYTASPVCQLMCQASDIVSHYVNSSILVMLFAKFVKLYYPVIVKFNELCDQA